MGTGFSWNRFLTEAFPKLQFLGKPKLNREVLT
jgi:hypothetical protein